MRNYLLIYYKLQIITITWVDEKYARHFAEIKRRAVPTCVTYGKQLQLFCLGACMLRTRVYEIRRMIGLRHLEG